MGPALPVEAGEEGHTREPVEWVSAPTSHPRGQGVLSASLAWLWGALGAGGLLTEAATLGCG